MRFSLLSSSDISLFKFLFSPMVVTWVPIHKFCIVSWWFYIVSWCFCGQAFETSRHIFLDCPWVIWVWDHFLHLLVWGMSVSVPHTLLLHWLRCASSRSHIRIFLLCFILWQVLKACNTFKFDLMAFYIDVVGVGSEAC